MKKVIAIALASTLLGGIGVPLTATGLASPTPEECEAAFASGNTGRMHECPDYVVKSQRWLFDGNGSLLEFTEERCELTREFTRTTVTRYGLEGGIWILKADGGKEVTETEQMCAYGENGVCGEWNAAGVPEWMPSE